MLYIFFKIQIINTQRKGGKRMVLYSNFHETNLKILEEVMDYEAMMNKKYAQYVHLCQDAQLKNICRKLAKVHKENYIALLNYLNSYQ